MRTPTHGLRPGTERIDEDVNPCSHTPNDGPRPYGAFGEVEVEIAAKFEVAALRYVNNSTAFQLRAMNILCEGLKVRPSVFSP